MNRHIKPPAIQWAKRRTAPIVSVIGPITIILVVVVLLIVSSFAISFWYLAYGIENDPANRVASSYISQPAEIRWHDNGLAGISANNDQDLLFALGFIHATEKLWPMMLWRQTAEGRLTTWFGSAMLPTDRLSRRLRFAGLAKSTFARLPADQQALLRTYSEGVNAAITRDLILTQDEFALLNIVPEQWEPWHTLAVERLFAWLSVHPDSLNPPIPSSDSSFQTLIESDYELRRWLQTHSFHQSMAAVLPGSRPEMEPTFFYRLSYGASTLPLIQEVQIDQPERSRRFLATVPGSLLFLAGQSADTAWALLPESRVNFSYTSRHDSTSVRSFERILNKDGSEFLATFEHHAGRLIFTPDNEEQPDSVLQLAWTGLHEGTDSFSFLSLMAGRHEDLLLQTGKGLQLTGSSWRTRADSQFTTPLQQGAGILVGPEKWIPSIAAHLDSLALISPDRMAPERWESDCYSRWARNEMTRITPFFFPIPDFQSPEHLEALTYLRNWDFSYDPSSIGASIFSYFFTDMDSQAEDRDSLVVVSAFERAVNTMLNEFGNDLSQWRYEITHPATRHYPAWSADSIFTSSSRPLSSTRFAGLTFAGKGHASTLCWGSLDAEAPFDISARWEFWTAPSPGGTTVFWNRQAVPQAFLDRYLIANRPGVIFELDSTDAESPIITRLLPGT